MPDYFSDNYGDEADSGNPNESAEESAPAYDDQPASQIALLPTDFFGGKNLQPGDTCNVKIVKVLDGQVQVSYEGQEEGGEDMMT